jgi:uncharacterized protein YndB with AHSA1/START domain
MAEHLDNPRASFSAAGTAPTLEVRRTIRAPRQRVFDAWTKAEELKRWHSAGTTIVAAAQVDLRVGGRWRIDMRSAEGRTYYVSGMYREIDPPHRLVYTWKWDTDPIDTVVTVEFRDLGTTTEVVLRHDGLVTPKSRADHERGWLAGFAKLANCV